MTEKKPIRRCSIEGCLGHHVARGWCMTHYKRNWRWGSPYIVHTNEPK